MQTSVTLGHATRTPWNKGKLIGQKPPLKLAEIWTVRTRLKMVRKTRDLALFNLAIDSKLCGCDLVSPRVRSPRDRVVRAWMPGCPASSPPAILRLGRIPPYCR